MPSVFSTLAAAAVLLFAAAGTANAASVAIEAAPVPPALKGCRDSSFTEGVCTFNVRVCSFRTTVCCVVPEDGNNAQLTICETDGTFTEAYDAVKEHKPNCFRQ